MYALYLDYWLKLAGLVNTISNGFWSQNAFRNGKMTSSY